MVIALLLNLQIWLDDWPFQARRTSPSWLSKGIKDHICQTREISGSYKGQSRVHIKSWIQEVLGPTKLFIPNYVGTWNFSEWTCSTAPRLVFLRTWNFLDLICNTALRVKEVCCLVQHMPSTSLNVQDSCPQPYMDTTHTNDVGGLRCRVCQPFPVWNF